MIFVGWSAGEHHWFLGFVPWPWRLISKINGKRMRFIAIGPLRFVGPFMCMDDPR